MELASALLAASFLDRVGWTGLIVLIVASLVTLLVLVTLVAYVFRLFAGTSGKPNPRKKAGRRRR